jgi:hypothetical protein
MAYIGIQPAESFTSFATQEFSTSATTSYTLDHAVANENEIALFVNNVRQQPGSGKAYTATGTALTLSAATASTDTMYCVFLGRALQTVTPATNSITNAMITDNTIESGKLFSTFKNGITEIDTWRVTADFSGTGYVTANWERDDTYGNVLIGTGMSESSGVFTFPSTGVYQINFGSRFTRDTATPYAVGEIQVTTDNSSYNTAANSLGNVPVANYYDGFYIPYIFDVTSTSTHKVKFYMQTNDLAVTFGGNTDRNFTYANFIRLGDT